jgi:hypothetical protein
VPKVTSRAIPVTGDSNRAVPAVGDPTRAIPATGDSARVSATKGNGEDEHLEINVLVEADDENSSDGEDGLARCARRQAGWHARGV